MADYAKMKVADLDALLKERGLPTSGKKADKIEQLTKDDEKKAASAAPAATKPAALHPEDEIDWDDDAEPAAEPAKAAPAATEVVQATATPDEPSTTAKAGGKGQPPNPQAVPNQVADIDPSKTDDLSVKPPVDGTEASAEPDKEENKEPAPDYTRGLAATNIDEEIEKRKARAKKFGLKIEDDEGLRKLERAKKFGETGPPKGLDEALPERSRKRGREDNEEGGRNKRRGGRFGGRRGRGNREGGRRDNRDNRDSRREDRGRGNDGGSSWMSESDRAKAEARKAKWAAPAASS